MKKMTTAGLVTLALLVAGCGGTADVASPPSTAVISSSQVASSSAVNAAPPTIASGPVLYWATGTGKARVTYLAGAGTSETNDVDFTTQDTWGRGLRFEPGSTETAEVVVENVGGTGSVTCHVERDAKIVVEQTSDTKAVCTVMLR